MAIRFSKRKIRCIDFKNREANLDPLAAVPNLADLTKSKRWLKVTKSETIHREWNAFYPKPSIGQFSIEENEINVGDTILIKGMTTGEQQLVITKCK
jgi:UPF0176 protein